MNDNFLYEHIFYLVVISPVSQNVTLNTNPEFVCQVNGTNLTLIWKLEVAGRVIEYCNTNISGKHFLNADFNACIYQ